MTHNEYEQRKRRLDEQLRIGIEWLQTAHRQQVEALNLMPVRVDRFGALPLLYRPVLLGGRSMVGHAALDRRIGVRVPASQPNTLPLGHAAAGSGRLSAARHHVRPQPIRKLDFGAAVIRQSENGLDYLGF